MSIFAGFRTRNLLTFVVPAVIALISAYWFHKKRKLKNCPDQNSANSLTSLSVTHTFENVEENSIATKEISYTKSNDQSCCEKSEEFSLAEEVMESKTLNSDTHCSSNGYMNFPVESALENLLSCPENEHRDIEEVESTPTVEDKASCISFSNSMISESDNCNSLSKEELSLNKPEEETNELPVLENELSLPESKKENISSLLVDSLENEHLSIKSSASVLESKPECELEQSETTVDQDTDNIESMYKFDKQPDSEFCSSNTCHRKEGVDSISKVVEVPHPMEGDLISGSVAQKNSPTSTGSPVSHSNDTGSDCEAFSSVDTSSMSLSELFSTSPIDSMMEQKSFQVDALICEEVSNDSGKGSTLLDPVSSCSLTSELNEVSPDDEPPMSGFHYSRRSNADVLCRQRLDSPEHGEDVSEQYNFYDSNCNSSHLLKKSVDALNEASCVGAVNSSSSSSSGNMNYVQSVDSKTLESNGVNHYIYEFELPQEFCGRLIGRQGKNVKFIKEHSNATVYIKRHPYNPRLKLAVIEGNRYDVNNALELLRKKFPPSQFPAVTLAQTNAAVSALGVPVPESLQRRCLYF